MRWLAGLFAAALPIPVRLVDVVVLDGARPLLAGPPGSVLLALHAAVRPLVAADADMS